MPEAPRPTAEDRLDIAELLAHYARALDTGDTRAFANTFTPDGVLNLPDGGRYRGAFTGREQIMQFAESFKDDPAFPGGQHFVSQITIEGDVQRCFVRSYVMRTLRMPNGTSSIYFLGQYEDSVVKVGGQWLFESRTVRRW
jgi:uncharacterized protein (TIGR02246 family)